MSILTPTTRIGTRLCSIVSWNKRNPSNPKLGESLEWKRLDHRRASRVDLLRQGSIDDDRETLEEIENWMIDKLFDFKRVFGVRLEELAR